MTEVIGSPPGFHFGSERAHGDVRFRGVALVLPAEINLADIISRPDFHSGSTGLHACSSGVRGTSSTQGEFYWASRLQ